MGGTASHDPVALIGREPMHWRQIVAIAILTACTAAEGFDVYAIAFAAPGIADAWNIDRGLLGVALAMDLVGMGFGAILLGRLADTVGRKRIIFGCLVVMAAGMALAARAPDIVVLSGARLLTGLGIGGLLATSSAAVAEIANDRKRSLAITFTIGGFSAGAIFGGAVVSTVLARSDRWETVFELGAIATVALVLPALLLVPESLAFLYKRQPANALARINRILRQQGRRPLDSLPAPWAGGPARAARPARDVRRTTALLTAAFFMYMVPLYFLTKWIPKLVADMGYPASSAGGVLVWAQVGGLVGTILIGLLVQRRDPRLLVAGALTCGAVAVVLFGGSSGRLELLTVAAAAAGFFIIGGNSGFYSIVALSFPSQIRASSTGVVIGAGRAGSAVGPMAAGLLFQAGWPLIAVSVVMGAGCLIAALAVTALGRTDAQPDPAGVAAE